jgi:hypothetical protein
VKKSSAFALVAWLCGTVVRLWFLLGHGASFEVLLLRFLLFFWCGAARVWELVATLELVVARELVGTLELVAARELVVTLELVVARELVATLELVAGLELVISWEPVVLLGPVAAWEPVVTCSLGAPLGLGGRWVCFLLGHCAMFLLALAFLEAGRSLCTVVVVWGPVSSQWSSSLPSL